MFRYIWKTVQDTDVVPMDSDPIPTWLLKMCFCSGSCYHYCQSVSQFWSIPQFSDNQQYLFFSRNLRFIKFSYWVEFTVLFQPLLCLYPAILIFVNFVISVPTLILKQPVLSPPRLSTPSLIIVIHSTSICLSLIIVNLFKTLLPVPLSKPLNPLILP